MVTIKRIMVPTDLSRLSQAAFNHAVTLARRCTARIYLVHVMEPALAVVPVYLGVTTKEFERRMLRDAEVRLKKLAQRLGKSARVATVVRRGNVTTELIKAARSLRANLIVISTHGRSGIGHVLVGSVAERIVRQASCPVLIVRPSR